MCACPACLPFREMEEAGYTSDSYTAHQLSLLRLRSIRSQHPLHHMIPVGTHVSHPTRQGDALHGAGPTSGQTSSAAASSQPASAITPPMPPSAAPPLHRGKERGIQYGSQMSSEERNVYGDTGERDGPMAELTEGQERRRGKEVDQQASRSNGGPRGTRGGDVALDSTPEGDTGVYGRGDVAPTGADGHVDGIVAAVEGDSEVGDRMSVNMEGEEDEEGEGMRRAAARDTEPVLLHKPRLMQ